MKVWKKLQVVFLALLLCTGMMTQPALAASLLQDGIEAALTTDKETYQQGEEIKVTLTVTNTNDTAVTNLSLENILPENFVLAENAETTKKMESLQAGETVTLTTVCTVKASDDKKDDENKENPSGDDKKNPTDNEKPGNGNVANDTKNPGTTTGSKDSGTTLTKDQGTGNAKQNGQSLKAEKLKSAPKMGDNTKIIVWVVLLVLAGAAIVVALKKKNRRNKMLAWFLCLIMTGSTVAGVFPERARAEAQSVNIGKVMELSKNILVDQTTVELKAKVEYTYVKSDDLSDDTKTYTRGEWVQMLAEKVEMNLDTDPDSLNHYYADTAGNAYEAAIEIAEKYGILPPPDIEDLEQDIPFFYPDEPATREFAAYTAVHAMGFNGIHSYDTNSWTDWDSITYQNEAAIAVGKGFLELNTENQFQPHALLSKKDVKSIFYEIDEIRQEDTTIGEEPHDNTQYVDGVLKKELENITDYTVVENADGTYTVTLPKTTETEKIGEGSVMILPANEVYISGIALKATTVTEDGEKLILTCIKPELWEVVSKIDFVGGGTALIGGAADTDEYGIATQANIGAGGVIDVGYEKNFEFNIGSNDEGKGKIDFEIPEILCVVNVDVGVNGVSVNELKLAVTENANEDITAEKEFADSGQVELMRFPITIGATGFTFDVVLFCSYKADGSLHISYSVESTQGFEYKDGTWRGIFDFHHGVDTLEVKGNMEGGIGIKGLLTLYSVFDLAGYYADLGLGVEAEFAYHDLENGSLACEDIKVYPYSTNGLDTDSLLGDVLKKYFDFDLEFKPLQNDENNNLRIKMHKENGVRVEKCTYASGGITGYVYSSKTRLPIENARVRISRKVRAGSGNGGNSVAGGGSGGGSHGAWSLETEENEIAVFSGGAGAWREEGTETERILYTDVFGKYSTKNLQDGTYEITVSATSYQTYKVAEVLVQNSEIRYVEDIYMVERHDDFNTGSVEGTITDAVTGDGITETAYIVRKGWNNQTGDAVTEGVFENADYTLSMENGNYTLEISKEGYVTNYKNITVAGDQIETANIVLVPGDGDGETAGELRIVLTWGEEPWDLDSHLACYSSDKPYHIWFGQTDFEGNSVGNLDVDDTSSYGPETITVRNVKADEKFSYFVHDYTNSYSEVANEMSLSGAKVQVYLEGKNIATYTIPTNQPGTLWHVFDFAGATKTIKSVNTLEYQNDPYTIGGIDQEMDDVDDAEEIEMYAGKVRNKKQPEQKVVVEETPLPETTAESVISESEAEKPGEAVSKSESEPDDENVAEDETVTP